MVFVEILFPLFLLIGAGALFSRTLRPSLEPLTQFALYVATPALVFHALVRHPVPFGAVGRLGLVMVAYTGAMWALAETAGRLLRMDSGSRRALALCTATMNVGNYGLPLVRFALGPEAVQFSILVFVVFNLPLATWAIWLAAGGTFSSLRGVGDFLKIPIFHATALAFLVSGIGLAVPAPVEGGLELLGQAAIPVLLVILGIQLHRTEVRGVGFSIAAAVVIRLVVSPFVSWALSGWAGFEGLERDVIVLQTSTPSAVLPLLYALRFDCRPHWIASSIFFTTILSAVSLSGLLAVLL